MDTQYMTDHMRGISIIPLRAAIDDGDGMEPHPQMDYHLHNLLYYDDQHHHVGILCLDTGDLYTYPCEGEKYIQDHMDTVNEKIARIFVDKVQSMLAAGKFERKLLFHRADQSLWDIFNMVKEYSFMHQMPRLAEYLQTTTIGITKGTMHRTPLKYNWAEYEITEQRFVDKTQKDELLTACQ